MMKFSVLLPTRNRLTLLKYAVESVRRQNYDDWEIVISDNFSDEDISGYVQSLKEQRIKYYRTDSFVPVTDNWNNALEKSTGDYVIMLGDDDCVMKDYFKTVRALVEDNKNPDFVFTNALIYAYPGVIPDFPDGFLNPYGRADFLKSATKPFILDKERARRYVIEQSMNFKLPFDYNMQFSAISRKFVQSLEAHGPFFQSPYPDFYAHNVMFLKAQRILICPIPLVVVGISPKSYGYYYFNSLEKKGAEFLKNAPNEESARRLKDTILPGSDLNTCWLFAVETIKVNYGTEFDLHINYRRYRLLQIFYTYVAYYFSKKCTKEEFRELLQKMRLWERIVYSSALQFGIFVARIFPRRLAISIGEFVRKLIIQHRPTQSTKQNVKYNNILEVFEKVDPTSLVGKTE